jgi:hypothetical protein
MDDLQQAVRDLLSRVAVLESAIADPYHYITFDEHGWAIQHPLACRPHMLYCEVHKWMRKNTDGPPPPGLGIYRAVLHRTQRPTVELIRISDGSNSISSGSV